MTEHSTNASEYSNNYASDSQDESLIDGIRRREEQALKVLLDRYGGQVHALCLRICTDELEASGIVTEVFWRLWSQVDRFDPARGSICTYLLTMARSRAIDARRTSNSVWQNQLRLLESATHSGNDRLQAPDEQLLRDEHSQEVRLALEQLTKLQRELLHLAFFEGMSHTQMAAILQTPLGTVKTHIRKGLQRLRFLLTELSESGR